MVKIAFVGSRSFKDHELAKSTLKKFKDKFGDFLFISGGARGADMLCENMAYFMGIKDKQIFEAEWDENGKASGMIRNSKIVENSDIVVAFWDGKSRGTADTIQKAHNKGIPVLTVRF